MPNKYSKECLKKSRAKFWLIHIRPFFYLADARIVAGNPRVTWIAMF